MSLGQSRNIRAGALSIGAFERGRWRLRRTRGRFRADAGHYWNLNRYSTGSNKLKGLYSEHSKYGASPREYRFCLVNANGRRELGARLFMGWFDIGPVFG